jgi:hypothetical protein
MVSTSGSSSCLACPRGTYSDHASDTCQQCAINFYNPTEGQGICTPCPPGYNTAGTGSTSVIQCVSPVPNFTFGTLSLMLVIIIFVWYIVLAKFYKVSFERKVNSVLPNIKKCKELIFYQAEQHRNRILKKANERITRSSTVKLLIFFTCAVIFCFLSIVGSYIFLAYHVFFTALILWRGLRFDFQLDSVLALMANGLADIAKAIEIPNFMKYALLPFFYLFDALASLHLNLSSVQVTCAGSQAPIELLINCFILGLLIIIIRADYQILLNLQLQSVNQMYLTNTLLQHIEDGSFSFSKTFYFCLFVTSFIAFDPFHIILRYSMGFISITTFVQNHGYAHSVTASCDQVREAPYFDSFLGYSASIFAWWLIFPAIYCLAEVVVPKTQSLKKNKVIYNYTKNSNKMSKKKKIKLPKKSDEQDDQNNNSNSFYEKQSSAEKDSESQDISTFYRSQDDAEEIQQQQRTEMDEDDNKLPLQQPFRLSSAKGLSSSRSSAVVAPVPARIIPNSNDSNPVTNEPSSLKQQAKDTYKKVKAYFKQLLYSCLEFFSAMLSLDMWLMNMFSLWIRSLYKKSVKHRQNDNNNGNSNSEKDLEENHNEIESIDTFGEGEEDDHNLEILVNEVANQDEEDVNEDESKEGRESEKSPKSPNKNPTSPKKTAKNNLTGLIMFHRQRRMNTSKINELWEKDYAISSLPPYYDLCMACRDELHLKLLEPFPTIFALIALGHFVTPIGRYYWKIVFHNYRIFFMACLGIWTKEVAEAYDIEKLSKNLSEIPKQYASQYYSLRYTANPLKKDKSSKNVNDNNKNDDKKEGNRDQSVENLQLEKNNRQERTMRDSLPSLISIMIGSRVLLFQVVPSFVFFATFFIAIAPTPLFIYDEFLLAYLPGLILTGEDSRIRAIDRELALMGLDDPNPMKYRENIEFMKENYSWRLAIRKIIIFWHESRLLHLMYSLIIFILSILMIVYKPEFLIYLLVLLLLLLPFILVSSLSLLLYIGRTIDLKDHDFQVLSLNTIHENQNERLSFNLHEDNLLSSQEKDVTVIEIDLNDNHHQNEKDDDSKNEEEKQDEKKEDEETEILLTSIYEKNGDEDKDIDSSSLTFVESRLSRRENSLKTIQKHPSSSNRINSSSLKVNSFRNFPEQNVDEDVLISSPILKSLSFSLMKTDSTEYNSMDFVDNTNDTDIHNNDDGSDVAVPTHSKSFLFHYNEINEQYIRDEEPLHQQERQNHKNHENDGNDMNSRIDFTEISGKTHQKSDGQLQQPNDNSHGDENEED